MPMPSFSTGAVAVLGSLNMDLVVAVDDFPRPGETITGHAFTTVPGGKGLNQAVAAARAGAAVRMLGAVGADAFGEQLRTLVTAEGMDAEHLDTADVPTGTAHIQVTSAGENSIVVVPGANGSATELTDARAAAIADAAYLVLQGEVPMPLNRAALGAGAVTVLTPAPVAAFEGAVPDGIDVLIGNELEIASLGGLERIPLVIETLGGDGVRWFVDGAAAGSLPARRVQVVDTTAAGDTFVGALVARLAAGATVEAAIEWAVAAASITVSRAGATSSIPTAAEVDAVLSLDVGQ